MLTPFKHKIFNYIRKIPRKKQAISIAHFL